jgi:hypothetical protein
LRPEEDMVRLAIVEVEVEVVVLVMVVRKTPGVNRRSVEGKGRVKMAVRTSGATIKSKKLFQVK